MIKTVPISNHFVDVHWCVNPQTGVGKPRTLAISLCSNCAPRDVRCYEVTVPQSELQSVINRMIEMEGRNGAH